MRYHDSLSSILNRRAKIMKNGTSSTMDVLCQYPQKDTEVATVWCGVIPQTGSLLSGRVAETQLSRTTHKVVIRYRSDVKSDMWLVIDGERYDILYVIDPYLQHERLEIFCEVKQR